MHRLSLFAVVFGLVITGCHAGHAWSSQDEQSFLSRCQKQQSPESCHCVLAALKRTLSASEYRALSDPGSTSRLPPPDRIAKVREAVMSCETEKK